eukprot:m.261084 g.261084  ORF g.261084 m.261084 type:complete len:394 (-) comp15573_c0_seq2:22-1203(-)
MEVFTEEVLATELASEVVELVLAHGVVRAASISTGKSHGSRLSEIEEHSDVEVDECAAQPSVPPFAATKVLTVEMVRRGLGSPGLVHGTGGIAMLELQYTDGLLTDVSVLSDYPHLQRVNLSRNCLSDVKPCAVSKHLHVLDVSQNHLQETILGQPSMLNTLLASQNYLNTVAEIGTHTHLSTLVLHDNCLTEIAGLTQLKRLQYLDISNNRIHSLQGLEGLPLLRTLKANGNLLRNLAPLQGLPQLKHLEAKDNKIICLRALSTLERLETLDLAYNRLFDITQLASLKDLKWLCKCSFQFNPFQSEENYRSRAIFSLIQLTHLDEKQVDAEDKVLVVPCSALLLSMLFSCLFFELRKVLRQVTLVLDVCDSYTFSHNPTHSHFLFLFSFSFC